MKQIRVSRSQVIKLTDSMGYRLVAHEKLGNAVKPYYTYSLVRDTEEIKAIETLLSNKTLKEIYNWLMLRNN